VSQTYFILEGLGLGGETNTGAGGAGAEIGALGSSVVT